MKKLKVAACRGIALGILVGAGGCIKTELRHCISEDGEVQPDQLCHRDNPSGWPRWVYGGTIDPDRPHYVKNYSLEPAKDSSVVNASGPTH